MFHYLSLIFMGFNLEFYQVNLLKIPWKFLFPCFCVPSLISFTVCHRRSPELAGRTSSGTALLVLRDVGGGPPSSGNKGEQELPYFVKEKKEEDHAGSLFHEEEEKKRKKRKNEKKKKKMREFLSLPSLPSFWFWVPTFSL